LTLAVGDSAQSVYPFFNELILPNVDAPQWVRYDMERIRLESSQFPMSDKACLAVRFVQLTFSTPCYETFHIGNMKFEVMKPQASAPYHAIEDRELSAERLTSFRRIIRGRLESLTLSGFQALSSFEYVRAGAGMTEACRNDLIAECGSNPFLMDLPSRMIQPTRSLCSLCGSKVAPGSTSLFMPCAKYQHLFSYQPGGNVAYGSLLCDLCTRESLQIDYNDVIDSCIQRGHIVKINRNRAEQRSFPTKFTRNSISLSRISAFLLFPQNVQSAAVHSILAESGGECRFELSGQRQFFVLCLPGFAKLQQFSLTLFNSASFKLSCVGIGSSQLFELDVDEKAKVSCDINSHQSVAIVSFAFEPRNGCDQIGIKSLELLGQFSERPMQKPVDVAVGQPVKPFKTLKTLKARCTWNSELRTQTFFLLEPAPVVSMIMRAVFPWRTSMSLIVAFFGSEGYLGNAKILVPEAKSLTEFSYPIQFDRILKSSCSQVRVFYLDRTAE
jgi:hypothetical protein